MAVVKATGLPFAEGLENSMDIPHTISYALMYRVTLDSFNELPRDKRPPRYMWDRPFQLREYLEHVWDRDEDGGETNFRKTKFYEFNQEDVE